MGAPRTLKPGMTGPDVEEWQRGIGVPVITGVFDEPTETMTRMWQQQKGLKPDGLVGPLTRAAFTAADTVPPPPPDEILPTPATFIAARYFGKGRHGSPVTIVVIHTAETPEGEKTARGVGGWFASEMRGKDGKIREGSTHYGVDAKEIVGYVRESDMAWGANGTNHNGIHIEHAGRASQTPEQWADAYSEAMLRRSAALVADICRRYGIPIKRLDFTEVRSGASGICWHADVSRAFPAKAGKHPHWDPGPNFPWAHFIELVMAADGLGHLKPMA
jgi:hypothetical protein